MSENQCWCRYSQSVKEAPDKWIIRRYIPYFITFRNLPVPISLNSSPPSAAYMSQWIGSALVKIMACRLFGAKPLSKPLLGYCQLDPEEQTSVKSYQNSKFFVQENSSENIVCEMVVILSMISKPQTRCSHVFAYCMYSRMPWVSYCILLLWMRRKKNTHFAGLKISYSHDSLNTLRSEQNAGHCIEDIFKDFLLKKSIHPNLYPKGLIDKKTVMGQVLTLQNQSKLADAYMYR